MIRPFHWFDSIDSTMHEASRLAAMGAPHGTIVGADEQSAGQGRLGRSWHSSHGEGLYVSIILRLRMQAASIPVVTLALGLAAADAIEKSTGLTCDLRWPNDVLIGGRKCCGILTQLHGDAAVAGIGINVNHWNFPADLEATATSLRVESGRVQSRESLLAALLLSVDEHIEILEQRGKHAIFRLFGEASSFVRGRRVVVESAADTLEGTTNGLNDSGFLILRKDDGADVLVLAGGVRPV